MILLEEEEWQVKDRKDYQLALIALQIRMIAEGFAKNPKTLKLEDFLIDFDLGKAKVKKVIYEDEKPKEEKVYVSGSELMKDPKWAAINAAAKASWCKAVGLDRRKKKKPGNKVPTNPIPEHVRRGRK